MKQLVSIILLSLSLAAFNITSHAAEVKIKSGPIDDVDLKANRLIIDDNTRYLATGYIVKNKKGEVVSAFYLKRGQVIKYKMNEDRKISEIIIVR